MPVEHNGAPAIPFTISDLESGDQLTALAHRDSLRVLSLS
jgi:hypothetical protein